MLRGNQHKAWQTYLEQGQVAQTVNALVASSWKRCFQMGIPSSRSEAFILENYQLRELQEKRQELLQYATPIMKHLYSLVKGTGLVVLLTDDTGVILKALGDTSSLTKAQQIQLLEGANWQENIKGTNAIGTALYERVPLSVHAEEHFLQANHVLTCSAAPIFDQKGKLAGVIDISGPQKSSHPLLLPMVVSASRYIEKSMAGTPLPNKPPEFNTQLFVAPYFSLDKFDKPSSVEPFSKLILGNSPALMEAVSLAKKAAFSNVTVLLQGESGTGKELFARAIHQTSPRSKGPFIAVNCGALPENLIESELFGYEEGAFTGARKGGHQGKFEMAQGGTLLLDEIGDTPLHVQTALLRVLQERLITRVGGRSSIPVDVRIIAATHRNLKDEVDSGRFRLDLYYRLNVIPVVIPSLQQRREDIPLLSNAFIAKFAAEGISSLKYISPQALDLLCSYPWPGNIRELENVILRMAHIVEGEVLEADSLPLEFHTENISPIRTGNFNLKEVEKQTIIDALSFSGGNISETARLLGIGRNTLYRKIREHRLDNDYLS